MTESDRMEEKAVRKKDRITLMEAILLETEHRRQLLEEKEKAEQRRALKRPYLDRIRGSLAGGAMGDALGYPVEFMSYEQIRETYGPDGIQAYAPDPETGLAVISDDTQMSLFTANGILIGETDACLGNTGKSVTDHVFEAYQEWLRTQTHGASPEQKHRCWLYEIPELHAERAPGMTCLSALQTGRMGTMEAPLNHSRGCGGVMRVAPLALHCRPDEDRKQEELDLAGAEIAAITHGHPLGYLPAAVLTHILSIGVYGDGTVSLREAVRQAWSTVRELFRDRVSAEDRKAMENLIRKAEALSEAEGTDEEHIREIGQGWTGDEALAIALYCSLRYPEDFSRGITAAVNHSGDSDSTGAVTGNILGAWLGYEALEEKWKTDLEMRDRILEMAEDLCYGCVLSDGKEEADPAWTRKYCRGHADILRNSKTTPARGLHDVLIQYHTEKQNACEAMAKIIQEHMKSLTEERMNKTRYLPYRERCGSGRQGLRGSPYYQPRRGRPGKHARRKRG